jgi:hypothetical protein
MRADCAKRSPDINKGRLQSLPPRVYSPDGEPLAQKSDLGCDEMHKGLRGVEPQALEDQTICRGQDLNLHDLAIASTSS